MNLKQGTPTEIKTIAGSNELHIYDYVKIKEIYNLNKNNQYEQNKTIRRQHLSV